MARGMSMRKTTSCTATRSQRAVPRDARRLGWALSVALALPLAATVIMPSIRAQTAPVAAAAAKTNIDDTWQGMVPLGKDFRIVVKIAKAPDGTLKSLLYNADQASRPLLIKKTTYQGGELSLTIEEMAVTYVAKMSPDGTTLTGEWKRNDTASPIVFVRATPDTAWAIPDPPATIPPMAADADPSAEVATIKPSDPDAKGKGFGGAPRKFQTRNTTLDDLISFAYSVHSKQLVNAPAWMETDKFDIVMQPDLPGAPSVVQVKSMMRKLLVSRFGLKFHADKREMSAYVLTVAKGGPKMTKSEAEPNTPDSFFFPKLGNQANLVVRNATMDDFVHGMQGAVFDRPVVNRTGIEGRWDCMLKWTPDETQFAIFNLKLTPTTDATDVPPPIFTAIQEQIGLKLDAQKTMVDVMVLDHVEKPSDN